jgi:predicted glycoside hydrolase/deacetylase ChbG (UPF0249 family)
MTRKMIIRGDDVGYTDVCNIGTFKAIEEGIVTQIDTMLECPGSVDALKRIRNFPWCAMGWHTHFWGSPVLDPREVPTLVQPNGRFRENLSKLQDVDYDEIFKEMDAQMQRSLELAGRVPDVSSTYGASEGDPPFIFAMEAICKKYGIHYGFATRLNPPDEVASGRRKSLVEPAREPYRDLDIAQPGPRHAYKGLRNGPLAARTEYDPVQNYLVEDPDHLAEHRVGLQAWHPGYLDDFIWADTNRPGNTMNWCRVMDVEWMTSERCKRAIIENKIELISTRDAINGTNEYQDHLKDIGSPLWVGNFAD